MSKEDSELTCRFTGKIPFEGAVYVRECLCRPDMCSCVNWSVPSEFLACWFRRDEILFVESCTHAHTHNNLSFHKEPKSPEIPCPTSSISLPDEAQLKARKVGARVRDNSSVEKDGGQK